MGCAIREEGAGEKEENMRAEIKRTSKGAQLHPTHGPRRFVASVELTESQSYLFILCLHCQKVIIKYII